MAFVPQFLVYFEIRCMLSLESLETLLDKSFPGLSELKSFINSLHTHGGYIPRGGSTWEFTPYCPLEHPPSGEILSHP